MTTLTHKIKYSGTAFRADSTGMSFHNISTAEDVTNPIDTSPSPSLVSDMSVTWAADPTEGQLLDVRYDGLGSYASIDGNPLPAFDEPLVNCLSNTRFTIKSESYAGTSWSHQYDTLTADEQWTVPLWGYEESNGGSVTPSGANNEFVLCNAPTGRGYVQRSFSLLANRVYALTFEIVSIGAESPANFAFIANATGLVGTVSGDVRLDVPNTTTGRVGLIFSSTSNSPSAQMRMGAGTNDNVGSSRSVTITKPQLEDITDNIGNVFSDWSGRPTPVDRHPANILSGGTEGIVTKLTGRLASGGKPWALIFGTGDSFANDAIEWPGQLDNLLLTGAVMAKGRSGIPISGDISAQYANDLTFAKYTGTILQGGINDIRLDLALSVLQGAIISMVSDARSAGLGSNIIIVGLAPFKNTNDGTWTTARQTVLDSYNAWVPTYVAQEGLAGFANIYPALEDPGNPDVLNPAHDSGDGLHPNAAGHIVIAQLIQGFM